ncbi:MAG: aldehyde dehydrogenase family protein [Pirellulales bacterium]
MRKVPALILTDFLEDYAARIEAAADALCEVAHRETGLPITPRLHDVELPRTVNQLRQAAAAAKSGSWAQPTIDLAANIRSCLGPIGPVWVFGPNNFPFAYNGIAGGDFASAIAAGNPVIAKANPGHPGTTRAARRLGVRRGADRRPTGRNGADDLRHGLRRRRARVIRDPRTAGIGFTGGRQGGLALKKVADESGKPIYLELSSINPVVFLPGALQERGDKLVEDYVGSCTAGAGQFCTNPGLVVLLSGSESEVFVQGVVNRFKALTPGTLLSKRVQDGLTTAVKTLTDAAHKFCAAQPRGAAKATPTRTRC